MSEQQPPTEPPQPPSDPPADKTFTQAELDRIVQDRVARERKKYEGFDELKRKAGEFDKLDSERKSDIEKANERAAKAEREAQQSRLDAQESRLRALVTSEAAKRNVIDPDAALALLDRSSLEFDDDGNPKDIAKAMDSLLEARPYLAGGGTDGAREPRRRPREQLRPGAAPSSGPEESDPRKLAEQVSRGW